MNIAIKLLRHAVGLLTHHPLKTVTVVAPALLLMGGVGLIAALAVPEVLLVTATNPDLNALQPGILTLVLFVAFVLSYALMAILWHRHTLSDSGRPHPITVRLVGGYLWRVAALALIQLAISLALVVPLIFASHSGNVGNGGPTPSSILLTTYIIQVLVLWLSLRLSLILPAAAIGQPISLRLSWQYTQPLSRPLWAVAAVLALVKTLTAGLLTLAGTSSPFRMLMLDLPVYILEGLLIFSVLTTLYAYQVQKVKLTPS